MKQSLLITLAAVSFVLAVSCSKQYEEGTFTPETNEQLVQLSASTKAVATTRTYIDDNFKTRWNDDDVIAVFDGRKREFIMTENSGGSATFEGLVTLDASSYSAVYPYAQAQSDNGSGVLTVTIPAEQVIASGDKVAQGALLAVASISSLESPVSFKNVVGLVKVTLGEGVASVKLTGADEEGIAGQVQVNAADGSLAGSPDATSVVIRPVSGTFAAGDYYIAVAPVTLSNGFTLTFTNQYHAQAFKTGTKALAIVQNGGKDLGDVTTGLAWPSGLPCGWNFYAEGYTSTTESLEALKATENGQHWLNDGYLLPTAGVNPDARLTAVTTKAEADIQRSFNPSIQINGLEYSDGYWMMTIPVKNFVKDVTRFTIEMGAGGAANGAGTYILGYSTNGTKWSAFGSLQTLTREDGKTFNCHLWCTYSTCSYSGYTNLRKKYIKKTSDEDTHVDKYSYKKYTFTSPVTIEDGTLYLRLRTFYNGNQSTLVKAKNTSWTDLKGFEVSFAEEE